MPPLRRSSAMPSTCMPSARTSTACSWRPWTAPGLGESELARVVALAQGSTMHRGQAAWQRLQQATGEACAPRALGGDPVKTFTRREQAAVSVPAPPRRGLGGSMFLTPGQGQRRAEDVELRGRST